MTILAVHHNEMEVANDPNYNVKLPLDFNEEKDFLFQLENTHPTDDIEDLTLVTNMQLDTDYELVVMPKKIPAATKLDMVIKIKGKKMSEKMSESTTQAKQYALIGFTYTRNQVFFV